MIYLVGTAQAPLLLHLRAGGFRQCGGCVFAYLCYPCSEAGRRGFCPRKFLRATRRGVRVPVECGGFAAPKRRRMVQGVAEVTSIPLPGRKELAQDVAAFRAEVSAASGCPASCWGRRVRALMGGFAPHQLSLVPPPLLGWLVEVGHSVFVKPRAFIVARLGPRHSASLLHVRRTKKSRALRPSPSLPSSSRKRSALPPLELCSCSPKTITLGATVPPKVCRSRRYAET